MTNTKDPFHRMEIIEKCYGKIITESNASNLLSISTRQVQRLVRNYREKGKLSLIHGLKNKSSNHSIEKDKKEKVLELIKQDKYKGFGPTLLSEYLRRQEHIKINTRPSAKLVFSSIFISFRKVTFLYLSILLC
jgi:transposase